MNNTVTAAEIKRRGMAAIEEKLRDGPVRIFKHNRPAAVILSEDEYQRLLGKQPQTRGMSALSWLMSQPAVGTRDKTDIDESLAEERAW